MTLLTDIQKKLNVSQTSVWDTATERAVARAIGLDIGKSMKDPKAFYDIVRGLTGPLSNTRFEIVEAILVAASHWSVGWLAYGLATAWHEAKFEPVREIGRGKGKAYGEINATGKAPYGRGLVQITWDRNYKTIDKALGLNGKLAGDYDLALNKDIAVAALVVGMEQGLYTGKSLASYIAPGLGTMPEFVQARRIINIMDRAQLIADYADKFKEAILAGRWS